MTNALTGRNSIDQLLRTTHQHHIYLSGMADRKASFLIAAASVMLTIIIGHFAEGGAIPIPLLILGGFTMVAAVLAVLCIIPRSQKIPTQSRDLNLLFFGEFAHLSVEEYWRRMRAPHGGTLPRVALAAQDDRAELRTPLTPSQLVRD